MAQAGTVRGGGQSAADAAALAAAQDDRDALFDDLLDAIADGDDLGDLLDGLGPPSGDGCGQADHFADRNRSDVLSCEAISKGGHDGYTVEVRTRFDTGDTFVPGTDNKKAEASATAVVKPRCELADDADLIQMTCDGEEFTIDPDDDTDVDLKPSDFFSVVLVG